MKFTKIFLFILLAFFFVSISFVNADTGTGSVTVTVSPPNTCYPIVPDPAGYGNACTGATSSPNVCGQTNPGGSGTIQCDGTCSGATGTTPPDSNCSYTLTVNTAGTGSGTVGGGGSKTYGTTATATESPNADSYFAGWSGDCNSSGQVTMTSNKTCTATFTKTPINGDWTSWSSWGTCSLTCGGGNQSATRTCTNPTPAYLGADCSTLDGGNSSKSQACNSFCCSPLTQTQTIQCSSRNSLWTGTITQTSTKSAYSSCTFGSWVDTSNNCSCAAPSYELQTVSCPTGYSGSITQERDKGAYSACLFGGWYQTYDGCTPNSCASPCGTIASGSTCTAYQTSSVTYPATCTSQTRTCTAGTLSNSYTNASCSVTSIVPTVTTSSATSITETTASSGGTINSNGGATISTSGIVWSTSSNPTTGSNLGITYNGWASGGPWTSSITSLSSNTTYHVRAYATNSVGTSYGSDVSFTTKENGVCGSSNNMSFYVSPTSGYCNAGSYSGISGTGPWTWSCNGLNTGTNASCLAYKAVDCVGNWSDTDTCSASCGGGVKQQVYTITTNLANGGNACPSTNGATRWGSTSCNTVCCAPTSQTQTVQCSSRDSKWTGTITQTSTKSSYASGCAWSGWTDTSNTCSCAAPSYELQTVNCPTGYSGSITQERDKGAYSACLFGGWYQTYDGCTINPYTVSTSAGTGGSISPTSQVVNYNSHTTFTIIPDTSNGYSIASVSGCGGSLSGSTYTTGAITGACTVTASFNKMTGSLSASNCSITSAGSSCNTTLSWGISYPITTPTAITSSGISDINVTNTLTSPQSGTQSVVISEGSRTFYLYNNGILLGTATATATRISPSTPTGLTATAGSCSTTTTNAVINVSWTASSGATSYTLRDGSSVIYTGVSTSYTHTGLTSDGSHSYTVLATNSGGSSSYSSAVPRNAPSLCTNIVSTSAGTGGSISPTSRVVNYNSPTTFIITPDTSNGYSIASVSGCGGSLSGSTYTTGAITGACTVTASFKLMTGTLTSSASSCVIAENASSCNVTLTWSTTNPIGTSAVTASGMTDVNGNSGSQSFAVPYNSRTFYLYNNGIELGSRIVSSGCNTPTDFWNGSICAINTYTISASSGANGTITPSGVTSKNYGSSQAYTISPSANYHIVSVLVDGSSVGAVGSYTFSNITTNHSISATFTIDLYTLTVNKAGTGAGNVTGAGTYNYGQAVTATASPSTGSTFAGWSGDCNGSGQVTMTTNKTCTATFTAVTISVTASPTAYSTIPNTNVSFTYTPTTNSGTTECRLLDNASGALTAYQANSPIVHTPPSSAGAYGYYIQCRNTVHTTVIATSTLITVTVVTVSVTASTPYNVVPNTSVSFTYTPTTNSGTTECLLLDNVLAPLTAYQLSSPIIHTVPNNIGSYGYYVKCRNTTTTTAVANSGLITVNTACANGLPGTSWNGSACVTPSGNITASNCSITEGNNRCLSNLIWSTTNPIGTSAVTTPEYQTVSATNSGSTTWFVDHGSRNFYLYNNGNQLGTTATANATCASGTVWSDISGVCEPPTGTLTATGCTIAVGGNSCDTTLAWTTTNPLSGFTSVVKTPNSSGTTVATANNNTMTYPVPYNNREFVLIHNGIILFSTSATAACAQKTTWNGSICELNAPKIDSFTAEPSTIFEGRASTLTWVADPDLVTYCTGTNFSTGNLTSGSVKVSPVVTTTYSITCGRSGYSPAAKTAIVKVIVLNIKEQ